MRLPLIAIPMATALAVAAALLVSSCTTTTVGNDVAAAEIALTGAEQVALIYTSRPRCGGTITLCSNQASVDRIKALDMQAYTAVKAVRNNSGLISAAWTAISAFQTVVTAATVK